MAGSKRLAILVKMSCCSKYLNLGCVTSCGTALLPLIAEQSGQHILIVEFLGVEFQYAFHATAGEKFAIPLSELNESGCVKFQIIQPDGTTYSTLHENQSYECFMMRTRILMNGPIPAQPCIQDYVVQDYWPDDYVGCEQEQECELVYVECGYWPENYSE